jgi:FkbM family methyltransferase
MGFEYVSIDIKKFCQKVCAAALRTKAIRVLVLPIIFLRQRWGAWRSAPVRRVAENVVSALVEDPVIRVSGYPGQFAVGRTSDILRRIVITGSYEPELVRVCKAYVDAARDAIDVGANIGLYSVLLTTLCRARVLAIEPTPAALARLRRNLLMNGVEGKVIVFPGAAAAAETELNMRMVTGREEYSTGGRQLHPSAVGSEFATVSVQAQTVDTLVKEHNLDPGFIKIDVEGMEHTVLAGMRSTLEKHRPVILAELNDPMLRMNGSSAREIINYLQSFGYTLSDPLADWRAPGDRSYGDLLCVPSTGRLGA